MNLMVTKGPEETRGANQNLARDILIISGFSRGLLTQGEVLALAQ